MRAFVTGGHGFAGTWLRAHLEEEGDEVVAPDPSLDVTDGAALRRAVASARPDAIYHLAGLTHVGQSWDAPAEVFRTNALGTLNLLEAAKACGLGPRTLVVSSAEVYGAAPPQRMPLTEDAELAPLTPYAASKAAAELVALQAHLGSGLPVVRVRPFNHIGPGQSADFAVSALASRIVAAQREGRREVAVGNTEPRRDFTDVRDVVRAYRLAVVRGRPGQVYNVCSGRAVSIGEVAHRLMELAGAQLELVPDPAQARPVDVPVLVGDASRLAEATGWAPRIGLEQTLADVLEHWRRALA
ncbi:MAG TPA: GDP-mannose 4,6-dehydratase [Acidimicrobiales bacterium]|nr:GDP-mannose 4,6-dehydratase [Acidimicrobiales bacterium]